MLKASVVYARLTWILSFTIEIELYRLDGNEIEIDDGTKWDLKMRLLSLCT